MTGYSREVETKFLWIECSHVLDTIEQQQKRKNLEVAVDMRDATNFMECMLAVQEMWQVFQGTMHPRRTSGTDPAIKTGVDCLERGTTVRQPEEDAREGGSGGHAE